MKKVIALDVTAVGVSKAMGGVTLRADGRRQRLRRPHVSSAARANQTYLHATMPPECQNFSMHARLCVGRALLGAPNQFIQKTQYVLRVLTGGSVQPTKRRTYSTQQHARLAADRQSQLRQWREAVHSTDGLAEKGSAFVA